MGLKDGDCTKETEYDPYQYEELLDAIFKERQGGRGLCINPLTDKVHII